MDKYGACHICPRRCGVDRTVSSGVCSGGEKVRLARAALHFWEEPPISGESGSGTVFFSGCPLQCVYCQNRSIATGEVGREVSIERLARIFLELQAQGALNINLVTPTHYAPQIIEALDLARSGELCELLDLPIVYNTSGYESVDALEQLRGYVDVFLTDFKYASPQLAALYSHAKDYPQIASDALDCMHAITGPIEYDEYHDQERMTKGIIVRHLLLPGHLKDSKRIMELLTAKPYRNDIIVSLMNQFTPTQSLSKAYPELMRQVSADEYDELIDYALDLGLERSFMQEEGTAQESFIPDFDYEGV